MPTVLLTGASSGIGRAAAALLAKHGYQVFGTSRTPAQVLPIPGVTLLPLDVQSPASIQVCVQSVLDRVGRIDVLINNAGLIGPASASEETDIQHARALFETNFFGVVQVTNAVLPVMRRQGSGKIVNISSLGGLVSAPPFFAFYTASKHALEGYTESLRYEVRPFHIQVALVEPGYTSTAIGKTIQVPDCPIPEYAGARRRVTRIDQAGIQYGSSPDNVARVILRILRQPRPPLRSLSGSDSVAFALASRLLPEPLFERLVDWMFLSWQPPEGNETIPTPQELGIHRFLFHTPTRRILEQTAVSGLLAVITAAAGFAIFRRKNRS